MGKLLVLAVVVAIGGALIAERLLVFRNKLGMSRQVKPKRLPNCHLIKGIEAGSTDIEILPNGLAFISSGIKFPGLKSFAPDKKAEILLIDLKEENPHPVGLKISEGFDVDSFNPHGISVYTDKDDTIYLFVINHPHFNSLVEVFKFVEKEKSLLHLKTIKHELLASLYDIVALGPESFYASNHHYFTNMILVYVESFLGLPWTTIVYYSPEEVKEVAGGFYCLSGVTISPDGKYIYAGDMLDHNIHVLEKHANLSLSHLKALQLNTLVDNISVEPNSGDIWVAGHPNAWKLVHYDPNNLPSSEVFRIQNILSEKPTVTQVYVDDGSVIQGSSVAAVYGNNLLIGTVFHRALHCQL